MNVQDNAPHWKKKKTNKPKVKRINSVLSVKKKFKAQAVNH